MIGTRRIMADHVALAYHATRAGRTSGSGCRWAAMSDTAMADCNCTVRMRIPPLLSPLNRGFLLRSIERMRAQDVRRTFGCGIRTLRHQIGTSLETAP